VTRTSRSNDQLTKFLLGQLPLAECEAIERQLFRAEDRLFDVIVALEDELRWRYVSGALSPGDRAAFQARYLRTASDRARLRFMRALLDRTGS
jgi:anti-sigma factor RsiW